MNDFTQYIEVNDKQGDYLEHIMFEMNGEGVKEAGCVAGVGAGKTVLLALMMLISKEELALSALSQKLNAFACDSVMAFFSAGSTCLMLSTSKIGFLLTS